MNQMQQKALAYLDELEAVGHEANEQRHREIEQWVERASDEEIIALVSELTDDEDLMATDERAIVSACRFLAESDERKAEMIRRVRRPFG